MSTSFDLPASRRPAYDIRMRRVKEWIADRAWSARWWVGGRMVVFGAWYVIPNSTPKTDLCVRINDWSQETERRIRDARAAVLREDVKRTTESWQSE